MAKNSIYILAMTLLACLASSCSSIQTGGSILKPAGYESEKTGWIQRNLPSFDKLSNLLPPPTDARQKWDETQKKQRDGQRVEEGF